MGYKLSEKIPAVTPADDIMRSLYKQAEILSRNTASILIYGESGVGKTYMAEHIIHCGSLANAPFVRIDCNALSSELFASELFGYMPNAFTGASEKGKTGLLESAHNGTVLFDEINELSLENQTLLLHFLQNKTITPIGSLSTKEINARIICTSGRDLIEMIHNGDFRSDLYYRIRVAHLYIPPIRMRQNEIMPFLSFFIRKYINEYRYLSEEPAFTTEQIKQLKSLPWEGNIREIQNLSQQICFSDDVNELISNYIRKECDKADKQPSLHPERNSHKMKLKTALKEYERSYISDVINSTHSLQAAADELGISLSTLCRKKAEYKIRR